MVQNVVPTYARSKEVTDVVNELSLIHGLILLTRTRTVWRWQMNTAWPAETSTLASLGTCSWLRCCCSSGG